MSTKITRSKLRKLILREVKRLNESGMQDLAYQIEGSILNFLENSNTNSRNIDDVIDYIYVEYEDYYPDYDMFKEEVIASLDYSFELEYDHVSGVVSVKPKFVDMVGY